MQCRLVVGREDGSIIIVPATQTVMLHLLHGSHQQLNSKTPVLFLLNNQNASYVVQVGRHTRS